MWKINFLFIPDSELRATKQYFMNTGSWNKSKVPKTIYVQTYKDHIHTSKINQEVLQSNLEKGLYAYSAANMEGVDVSSIFGSCEKVEIF